MATAISQRLQQKLDEWKRSLLLGDGRGNSLLSFRPARSSVLRIIEPSSTIAFALFQHQKSMTIPFPTDGAEQLDLFDPTLLEDGGNGQARLFTGPSIPSRSRRPADEAVVDADPRKLPSILYRLRLKAQTALNERGVNVLFAVFGTLEWTDQDDLSTPIRSPLVLVPVELSRESLRDPYKLRPLDEECILNPVLVERLRANHAIDLALDPEEIADLDLDAIVDRTRDAVARQPGWAVSAEGAYIGIFSFLKMSMFKELDGAATLAAQSPIVRRLAGDEDVSLPMPSGMPTGSELDERVALSDTFNVLDADSSQLEAIVWAKAGANLVIQGPPGTGKSQTIANIIAECLAAGRTVLFVSEKMAALEVVYKRLQKIGLHDFCLEAHSHKANKREIIRQLGAALERPTVGVGGATAEHTLSQLQVARDRLNRYVRALHATGNPLKRSVYWVQGEVAARQGAPLLPFPFPASADLTGARLAALQDCVYDLCTSAAVLRAGPDHPWFGCTSSTSSLEQRDNILYHLTHLRELSVTLDDLGTRVAQVTDVSKPRSVDQVRELSAVLTRAATDRLPLSTWLGGSSAPEIATVAVALETQVSVNPDELRKRWHDRVVGALRASAPIQDGPPAEVESLRMSLDRSLDFLEAATTRVRLCQTTLQGHLDLSDAPTLAGARASCLLAGLLLRNPRAESSWFDPARLAQATDLAREAAEHTRIWNEEGGDLRDRFGEEIFDFAPDLLLRYTQKYASFLRILRPRYYRDRGTLRRLSTVARNYPYAEAVAELQRASRVAASRQWLRNHQNELATSLGLHFVGEKTDWEDVQSALDTAREILLARRGTALPAAVITLAAGDGTANALLGETHRVFEESLGVAQTQLQELGTTLPWGETEIGALTLPQLEAFATNLRVELTGLWDAEATFRAHAEGPDGRALQSILVQVDTELGFLGTLFHLTALRVKNLPLTAIGFDEFSGWLTRRLDCIDDLDAWIAYQNVAKRAETLGLGALVVALRDSGATSDSWPDAFLRHVYQLWLDKQYEQQPALAEFRGEQHDAVVRRFRELDRAAVDVAARRVRRILLDRAPQLSGTPSARSELGTLMREVAKRARHKPLRRLFREIPTLLLALKPCVMMSPLSLSQYLDPDRLHFDVVIFDEASQIRPEDAIGAIMRGTQVIVAGDEHQLPPTSFFSTLTPDSGDEWDEAAPEVYESILEACLSAQITPKMLRWHYRSHDESLIAFSNRFIYDGRLITFPSAYQDDPDRGVVFVHVLDGVYDRGSGSTHTNQVEAAAVVELVIDHAARYLGERQPRSLGVVAFSETQQLAILQILDKRRRERPELEAFFAKNDGEEFFVKNLENVQGDERDVIFFSIGYGRNASGQMSMNFGPLNRAGGERRLNVAITRARFHVKVVSSITGDAIDLTRTNAEGVKLLKQYLDYAEKGESILARGTPSVGDDFESPFEVAVARALELKGLKVQPQVGCAGFRVDLGIVHPDKPGRYVLGVECDGATYHSSATARDRDRLRQQVLEGLGWHIHRIWSRDWVRTPVREMEKVLEAYRIALAAAEREPGTRSTIPPPPPPVREEPPRVTLPASDSAHRVVSPPNVPQASPYRAAHLPRLGSKQHFAELPVTAFLDPIVRSVRAEGPVATHVVRQRVAACWDIARVGHNVARRIDDAIALTVVRSQVNRKGNFLWPPEMTTPTVRMSGSGEDARPIAEVCPEEIDEAVLQILRYDFALAHDDLIVGVARLLGYDRAARHVTARIGERIAALVQAGDLARNGDQISRGPSSGQRSAG
jgi:very-short-patch-repair endonuclease